MSSRAYLPLEQPEKLFESDKAILIERYRGLASSATTTSELIARPDPKAFVRDVLGAKPTAAALKHGYTDPWSPDQGRVLDLIRDERKVAVAAGVGVGKTRCAAWVVLWFLYSRRPSKVITTAPTWIQVEKLLWKEIGAAWSSSAIALPGRKLQTEIQLDDEWFALGLSTTTNVGDISATRFQGFHSPNVLVVLDEATGVPAELWEGAEGLAIGPDDRIFAIGNPTDPASRFKTVFGLSTWKTLNLDCRNHPNVVKKDHHIIPGAVTKEWIEDKLEEYGSVEAPLFQAKVVGRFPDQAADALISLGWVAQAQTRWELIAEMLKVKQHDDGRGVALGMDVAGEGDDLTITFAVENGRLFLPRILGGKYAFHVGRDVMKAAAMLQMLCKSFKTEYGHTRVRCISLDDTGLGQGVSARIMELQAEGKFPKFTLNDDRQPRQVAIDAVNFGAGAFDRERFEDKKDELWWEMREELRTGTLALPPDSVLASYGFPKRHSLVQQLITPFYAPNSSGRIIVFDKRSSHGGGTDEKTRERVKNLPSGSPDLAHAALLARRAWSQVRPDASQARAKTTEEAFVREMVKLAQARHKNRKRPTRAYRGRNW